MDWKSVDRNNPRESLPKDRVFLALWKGTICLCEFDDDTNHFYIGMMPACYFGFWKLDIEREREFTHWCELKLPDDY